MNNLDFHSGACRMRHKSPVAPHAGFMQASGDSVACPVSVASQMTDRF